MIELEASIIGEKVVFNQHLNINSANVKSLLFRATKARIKNRNANDKIALGGESYLASNSANAKSLLFRAARARIQSRTANDKIIICSGILLIVLVHDRLQVRSLVIIFLVFVTHSS